MQFLTAYRHRSVLRDELITAVWPDVDEENGRHRLHQAVYELRRILHAIDPDRSPLSAPTAATASITRCASGST
jgi:DNA-binding SARP family transcriptional activator